MRQSDLVRGAWRQEPPAEVTAVNLPRQMVMAIAAALDCKVDKAELEKFAEKRGRNPDAVDLYKRGRSAQAKRSKVDMEEAYIKAVDKTGFEALLKRENMRATQQ